MQFKHYDPDKLIPELKRRGIPSRYAICPGCVLTDVPPEDCIRSEDDMKESSMQSDLLCSHCYDTAEEFQEPFHLHDDPNITEKLKELEAIVETFLL